MRIPFWKLSGAGNDFVLLAGLPKGRSGARLARRLCDRRRGVGADGLLVMSRRAGRTRLNYWNADGSVAFCGNGSRCGAIWAATKGWSKKRRFVINTNHGPLTARLTTTGRAAVSMPAPKGLCLGRKLTALNREWLVHFVNTGAPHAVVFVPNVEKTDVGALGRALRFHKTLGKAGANVDFVEVRKNVLIIRTYERGVEGETLACGTGVVAAAFVARALGRDLTACGGGISSPYGSVSRDLTACGGGISSPYGSVSRDRSRVKVRSGAILTVSFDRSGASLEGPGEVVFTGEASV